MFTEASPNLPNNDTNDQSQYVRQIHQWHHQMANYHEQQRLYHLEQARQLLPLLERTPEPVSATQAARKPKSLRKARKSR